jgi:PAS domain S-box-containing protein
LFSKDGLDTPDFARRLEGFLGAARERLGVRSLAIAELRAPEGRFVPVWRSVAAESSPVRELTLLEFGRLAAGVRAPGDHEDLAALGAAEATVDAVPLEVRPRLLGVPDTLLVVVHSAAPPPPEHVDELRVCLERGLSADRRARVTETVLAAVEHTADAVELTDLDGRLFYVNPAWERFSGYAESDAIGLTAAEVFRDSKFPLHDAAFYQFTMAELHAGRPWMGALSGRARDGRRLFYEVNVAPFAAPEQGFRGHVAIRRDLAHRSERDEALALAHHEFRAVLSAIPDGVSVLREGRIYFANAAFQAIVRQSESGVIGRPYTDFVHPDDRAQFEDEHRARVTRVRLVPAEGPPRLVEISTAGEVSFEGKPAMILLSRDTTDYQLAREELSRAEKLSALGALSAGVAHELNNPLAYVALNLNLLSERVSESLAPADRELLDETIGGVRRMRDIATELRTFSGKDGPGPPEPVDVSRALTSALNMAQNEIRHRARLLREFEDGLYVLAREGQLVQVFVNVLVNAAQAMDGLRAEEQLIRVSSHAPSDSLVKIEVEDTGAGIPEALMQKLFDPFSTSKRRGEGSGLGLAICKRIVQAFGGQIQVESAVGKGTTVSIELPRTSRAHSIIAPRPRLESRADGPAYRVLIVDDEGSISRALQRVLDGHEVVVAEDGAAALARLASDSDFDVVLCDLMMPRLPGAELYARACELRPELSQRFLFMTGGAVTPSSKEFLQTVGSNVLWKPFDATTALASVEQVARRAGPIRAESTAEPPNQAAPSVKFR